MRTPSIAVRRIAVLLLALAAGCATNPVTGKSELSLVSESSEISMGKKSADDVAATVGLYPDSAVQRYVSALGASLAARTERPGLPWQFAVVDDPAVNAFALPGGYVFVTRGLLTHLSSEAELATVIGHEAGHVAAKHSVHQMSEAELATLGLGLGMALSKDIAKYGNVAAAGLGILFLKFSRDDESQADQLGFKYALADSFDVRWMVPVFVMLDGVGKLSGGSKLPEWQSTHPDPQNRVAATKARLAALTVDLSTYKLGQARYLRLIDGMVYGEDPRQGYFEGTLFVHPALKFGFQFPVGWKTQNRADAVLGMSAAQDALIELRLVSGATAEASQKFLSQQGVQSEAPTHTTIHGLPAMVTVFSAQDANQAAVQGYVAFIEYDGATYQILSYTTAAKFSSYAWAFQRSLGSFEPITDAAVLKTQPVRVHVERIPRAMTLKEFNTSSPSTISLRELALINGLEVGATLQPAQLVKRVSK